LEPRGVILGALYLGQFFEFENSVN